MLGDVVRDDGDEAPLLLGLSAFTLFFMMLSHTGGRLYLPPSLLRLGFSAHTVELDNTEILTTEPRWFERGVKEAIYIRALNPSLNRDGGRYNLPPVWDNIIKKRVKAERPRRRGASSPSSRTTSPNIAGTTD